MTAEPAPASAWLEDPPLALYKYRSLEGPAATFTRDIIVNNRLWFSSVDAFNDPFDSFPHFSMESTDEEYDAYLVHLIEGNLSKAPAEIRRHLLEAMRKQPREVIAEQMHASGAAHLQSLAVCCLSAANDQVLMWSHYASSHTGVCLRFNITGDARETVSAAYKVRYSADRPEVNRITGTKDYEDLFEAMLVKADFWAHEQEYRLFRQAVLVGAGHECFAPERLDGVIFGARCSAEDRDRVRGWLAECGRDDVELLEAVPDRQQFRLDIRAVKPDRALEPCCEESTPDVPKLAS